MKKNVISDIERIIRASLEVRRALGYKQDHAFEDVAKKLGTTARRVCGFLRGEVFKAPLSEYQRYLDRWWADMDHQAAELRKLAERIEREAEIEWGARYQLSFNWHVPPRACSLQDIASSKPGARSGAGM